MNHDSRRKFIKQFTFLAAALPFAGSLGRTLDAFAKEKAPVALPAGQSAISESDAIATAIGFHHHIKDTDFSKYPQRKKPEAKNQFCKSCALYTPVNEGWGKCQMLTAGLVSAEGWCSSWNKKS